MKKTILAITAIALLLLSLSACIEDSSILEPSTASNHTTFDGIYITIESIDEPMDGRKIHVTWHNETDETATFGLGYAIERLDGEEWISVQKSEFAIPELACVIKPHTSGSQSYATEHFNLRRDGVYRIKCSFYVVTDNESTHHETYAEFTSKKD